MNERQAESLVKNLVIPAITSQMAATSRQIEIGIEMAKDEITPDMGTTEATVLCVIQVLGAREDDLDEWLIENYPKGQRRDLREAIRRTPDWYTIRAPYNYLGYAYILCDSHTNEFVMPMTETERNNLIHMWRNNDLPK